MKLPEACFGILIKLANRYTELSKGEVVDCGSNLTYLRDQRNHLNWKHKRNPVYVLKREWYR